MTELMPTTVQEKREMTEAEIQSSMKIGRRVLETQLSKQLEGLEAEKCSIANKISLFLKQSDFYTKVKDFAVKEIDKDADFTALRRASNRFDNEGWKTNGEMMHSIEQIGPNYSAGGLSLSDILCRLKATNEKELEFEVRMKVRFLTKSEAEDLYENWGETNRCGIVATCSIVGTEIESLLGELNKLYEEILPVAKDIAKVKSKLNNLDKAMKEIEASILVKELQETTHGRKVLELTESVIAGVLGSDGEEAILKALPGTE